jgi:Post-segregation antitoxin CcdA
MNISVPDSLAAQVREQNIAVSAVCQRALRAEVDRAQRAAEPGQRLEEITIEVGEPEVTVGFTGRWLLEPDPVRTRTGENGRDAGAYWGVALTQRGRIAVYTAHCNGGRPARLNDYDGLGQAAAAGIPGDIIALAAAELHGQRVLWRDI